MPGGNPVLDTALHYVARGLAVFPCHSVREDRACTCPRGVDCPDTGKHPMIRGGVLNASHDPREVHDWFTRWPWANIGIACGETSGVFVVDVDPRNGGTASLQDFERQRGEFLPPTYSVNTGGGGKHYFYRYPAEGLKGRKWLPGVDVKSDGGYVVAPPSRHKSGLAYAWNPAPAGVTGFSEMPVDVLESIGRRGSGQSNESLAQEFSLAGVPEGERDDTLFRTACSLRRRLGDDREAVELIIRLVASRCNPPFPEEDALKKVEQAFKQDHSDPPNRQVILDRHGVLPLTDDGNACRFAEQHEDKVRHVAAWGWMVWMGDRWERDDTLKPQELARETVRRIAGEAVGVDDDDVAREITAWGLRSQAKERIRAVTDLARSDPRLVVVTDTFDADKWALNCGNGTLNLVNGELRPHRREDYHSKITAASYRPGATCGRWMAFLERILPDADVREFLQRAIGYSLTGVTREKAMFILWGSGDNGKTVFIEVLRRVFGGYSMAAPSSMLVNRKPDAIPNDIARLKGARLVTAAETRSGAQLAVDLIKQMTGGDTLTVRYMRAEWFEFEPEFKLWLATNHAPRITDFGDAIWNRLRLVPFTVSIPKAEQIPRDRFIDELVREEADGILRWAVEGCRSWQERGLKAPLEVMVATEEYRDEQDTFGEWLEDRTVRGPRMQDTPAALHSDFMRWQAMRGEKVWTMRAFTEELKTRGFVRGRMGSDRVWSGLKLKGADIGV